MVKAPSPHFGIAGFFAQDTEVFYEVVFSTAHLGRVSDLLTARLRESGVDELRLRVLLAIGAFTVSDKSQLDVKRPIGLECGVDSEKLVLGVSFILTDRLQLRPDDFSNRIINKMNLNPLESLIHKMTQFSDEIRVRYQEDTQRIEMILLAFLSPQRQSIPALVELLIYSDPKKVEEPKPKKYTQLGDLDFTALLGDTRSQFREELSQTVDGSLPPVDEIRVVSKAPSVPDQLVRVVKGKSQEISNQDFMVVPKNKNTSTSENDTSRFVPEGRRVKGHSSEILNQDLMKVSSRSRSKAASISDVSEISDASDISDTSEFSADALHDEVELASHQKTKDRRKGKGVLHQDMVVVSGKAQSDIEKEQQKSQSFNSDSLESFELQAPHDDDSDLGGASSRRRRPWRKSGSLSSFWKGTKKKVGEFFGFFENKPIEEEVNLGPIDEIRSFPSISSLEEKAAHLAEKSVKKEKENIQLPLAEKEAQKIDEAADAIAKLENEDLDSSGEGIEKTLSELWTGGVERSIARIKDELPNYKEDFKTERGVTWIHGIAQGLIAEKSRFIETARQLKIALGTKERKQRARIKMLTDELGHREAEYMKQTVMLKYNRDQLANAQGEIKDLKEKLSTRGEDNIKHKYQLAQRNILTLKDENAQLTHRVEDLKAGLLAKQTDAKAHGVAAMDNTALREKYVQVFRQSEELKRANRSLQDQLNDSKRANRHMVNSVHVDESKHKLEAALKANVTSRREVDELRTKLVIQQKQEANLKSIVSRLQAEVTRLSNKRKNTEDGSQPPSSAKVS